MLIVGDLSGIQDFLFDVRETGGKQAASLRFRSLRMQVIAECLARKLLWALELDDDALLFCAAGKFAVNASGDPSHQRLDAMQADVESWLLQETHGRLRFALAAARPAGSVREQYESAMTELQAAKLRPWASVGTSGASWPTSRLIGASPYEIGQEADRDAERGRQLLRAARLDLTPAVSSDHSGAGNPDEVAGVAAMFAGADDPPAPVHILLDKLSRHIPRHADDSPVEFVELAQRARGAPMLAVLKADADSLGLAVRRQLKSAADLTPLRKLSQRLESFFGQDLEAMLTADPSSPFTSLYTVFAGGDDLLMVGPWDVVLDFAGELRVRFADAFADLGLTLSAGVALVKPRFPIRLAARQAEAALESAKHDPAPGAAASRDQIAALGECWKWDDHARVIEDGRRLADWTDAGVIRRGWLQTLLQFLQGTDDPMTASRAAWHVGRNWPKPDARDDRQRDARALADDILDLLDRPGDPAGSRAAASLRYAVLATRHTQET